MVVVVGNDHLARVRGEAARIGEVARAAALGTPRDWFGARQREALDAVVAGVGDVDVAAADRDTAAGWVRGVERGVEVELARFVPGVAPRRDEAARGVELLDAVVARVDDVDVARGVGREAAYRAELPHAAAIRAPLRNERARGIELLHD